MDQEVLNAYLDLYPHGLGRAFLRNYIEFKDLNLKIQRKTGHAGHKKVEQIPMEDMPKIREKLYERGDMFGLLFDLSESCALRKQEVLNIKGSDITTKEDGEKKYMFIKLKKTKGEKERLVFVLENIAILVTYWINNNHLSKADFLFRSSKNPARHFDQTQWNKAFTRACLEATGKRYHPHQLRHRRSLTWYEQGLDITKIQRRLGHESIATTMLYINPDEEKELEMWSHEEK